MKLDGSTASTAVKKKKKKSDYDSKRFQKNILQKFSTFFCGGHQNIYNVLLFRIKESLLKLNVCDHFLRGWFKRQ